MHRACKAQLHRRRPSFSEVEATLTKLSGTIQLMTVAQGTVRGGKVVLQGIALPEGSIVTVLADDDRPAVKLSPALEAELQAAIDEADAEDGGAGPEFLESLKRYG